VQLSNPPYVVLSMSRCRTAWLARFLTYGDWACGHEEIRHARSLDDIKAWFSQPNTGTAETAGAAWWRLIPPGVRVIVVRRPVADVVESWMRLDIGMDRATVTRQMERQSAKLDQIEARVPGVLSVQFDDLANEETCARVFEFCLPYPHDQAWWAALAPVNLQINNRTLFRHYQAFRPQLDKVAGQAKHRIIAGMARPVGEVEGLTFQTESFDRWYSDAAPLFREHMVQTDQAVDDYTRKNLPLLRAIDELGMMQITTARSNGRMFGYIMAVIGPSLDSPDKTEALFLPFFASKDAPGVGRRLQRASIEGLRARGVDDLFLRAGVRGDGPRLGALCRRLGAEEFGQLYKLDMKAA